MLTWWSSCSHYAVIFVFAFWTYFVSKNVGHLDNLLSTISCLLFSHIANVSYLLFMSSFCSLLSCMQNPSMTFSPFFCLTSIILSLWLATEKLIEGLKSPETSLLLPDLLTLADPFNSSAESSANGTSSIFCPLPCPKIPICSACNSLPSVWSWSHKEPLWKRSKKGLHYFFP